MLARRSPTNERVVYLRSHPTGSATAILETQLHSASQETCYLEHSVAWIPLHHSPPLLLARTSPNNHPRSIASRSDSSRNAASVSSSNSPDVKASRTSNSTSRSSSFAVSSHTASS